VAGAHPLNPTSQANMSLFQKSDANAGPVTFNGQESVVAFLFLIVTADGTISPCEEELVVAASDRMKLLRDLSIDQFNEIVYKIRDTIEASGRDAVFDAAVNGLPPDLHNTVYALAADVVLADGSIQPEEGDYLRKAQEALGVTDEMATKVLEVMRIKNCG
jgi:uncharacterized tellurite resistance protein B-like protein